ncbi:hypothetical protein AAON49_08280 [Pseudotenacibaculum sp. MALMAid0570]|uniref:hypothetical protein n=1 Tax=Pseudotenacibaculum sp. MALMAid0570 TaxID=3143938 RepID=UPI0032DF374B
MASIKNLKKDINYVLGDIIDEAIFKAGDPKKTEAFIDETIATFDELIAKVNAKDVENKKAHFKSIGNELESKAVKLLEKVDKL